MIENTVIALDAGADKAVDFLLKRYEKANCQDQPTIEKPLIRVVGQPKR